MGRLHTRILGVKYAPTMQQKLTRISCGDVNWLDVYGIGPSGFFRLDLLTSLLGGRPSFIAYQEIDCRLLLDLCKTDGTPLGASFSIWQIWLSRNQVVFNPQAPRESPQAVITKILKIGLQLLGTQKKIQKVVRFWGRPPIGPTIEGLTFSLPAVPLIALSQDLAGIQMPSAHWTICSLGIVVNLKFCLWDCVSPLGHS